MSDQLIVCRSTAYEYSLSYVRSLPPKSSIAKDAAIDVITTTLRLPSLFDFDRLYKLDAVVFLKDHELFSLLQIFLSGGLPELKQWQASHAGAAEKYSKSFRSISPRVAGTEGILSDLSDAELDHKMRLLTLATLGFKNIGQNLSYTKIAEALQVDVSEVEKWVIDGMFSCHIPTTPSN